MVSIGEWGRWCQRQFTRGGDAESGERFTRPSRAEVGISEPLREATADVFESWLGAIAARFEAAGISSDRARELAIEAVAALEGAFILSRAMRTTVPVEIAGRATVASLRAALPRAKGRAAKGRL